MGDRLTNHYRAGNDSVAEAAMASSTTTTPSSPVSPLLSEQLAAIELPPDQSSPTSDPSNDGSRPEQQQHETVQPPLAKKGADINEPPNIGSMSCSDLVAHLRRHEQTSLHTSRRLEPTTSL